MQNPASNKSLGNSVFDSLRQRALRGVLLLFVRSLDVRIVCLSQYWSDCCCFLLAQSTTDKRCTNLVIFIRHQFNASVTEGFRSPPKSYKLFIIPRPTTPKIFMKFMHNFVSNTADRQTDKQTNKPGRIQNLLGGGDKLSLSGFLFS